MSSSSKKSSGDESIEKAYCYRINLLFLARTGLSTYNAAEVFS